MDLNVPKAAEGIINDALLKEKIPPGLIFFRYLSGGRSENHYSQLQKMLKRTNLPTLRCYRERFLSLIKEYKKRNPHLFVSCFRGKLVGRLVPGLGIPSVFENGIALHHIHGFPYIPGSSLKGIAQDYALKMEMAKEDSPEFIAVFGKQTTAEKKDKDFKAQQGKAIFFDAIPLMEGEKSEEILTLDVMTPHYSEYYKSKGVQSPGDYLKPNPIVFLTVKEGVSFYFYLLASDIKNADSGIAIEAKDILCYAEKWLKGALSSLGAGAKTSSGYGYFNDFKNI